MLKSSQKLSEEYSYFEYRGSDSKPPCEENVNRYIMRYSAKIGLDYYEKLKKHGIKDAEIDKDNIRVE